MSKTIIYPVTVVLSMMAIMLLGSCISEEDFPTPASARLRFSVDTLDLDTVVIGTASATRTFTIYNDTKDGVSITSIAFEGEGKNRFLANVDGTFINAGLTQSIDCRGKDSLIAFVQFNAEDTLATPAEMSEATLVFTLKNGSQQSIAVQGYSLDAEILRGLTISADTTLTSRRPYLIYDSLVVADGATLTLSAGTTLLFHSNTGLRVDGTLRAEGTLESPVTFRGDRFDDMFQHQAYDRIDNQWEGIVLSSSSYDNHLNYCDIHASNYGIFCDSSDISKRKLTVENSIIHNTHADALRSICSQIFVGNTQISNAEGDCVLIVGGDALFVHCTVASFNPFTSTRGNALVFMNTLNNQPCPLQRMEFYNSIITGYASDEVFAYRNEDESIPFNYAFHNSLLDTPEITDDANITNNVWEQSTDSTARDRNFRMLNTQNLYYDFRLVEASRARGIADPDITAQYYPLDRLGIRRSTAWSSPDAGCYQYTQEEE